MHVPCAPRRTVHIPPRPWPACGTGFGATLLFGSVAIRSSVPPSSDWLMTRVLVPGGYMGPFLSAHDSVTRRAMRKALWKPTELWKSQTGVHDRFRSQRSMKRGSTPGATVWFCEGALPRTGEKCKSAVCNLRSGEPVHGSQELLRAMAV